MGETKLKVIVSDFHLGEGQEEGYLNPWESFHHDDRFAELLRHYCTDYYEDEDVELIINGDFFDLLMVRYDGGFPDRITERIAAAKLKACLDGHPIAVDALRMFVNAPHKRITVLPGNHDFELVFPACHRLFREYVCGEPEDERMHFVVDRPYYELEGVQIHHGMQFEPMNRYDWKRMFNRSGPEPHLNLPWGSVFILKVLNDVKERRPYIDHVQPFSLYLLGALFLDTRIALRLMYLSVVVFFTTRVFPLLRRDPGVRFVDLVRSIWAFSAFPNLEKQVKKILDRHPRLHAVILGHTHLAKVRRFGPNRTYVNTGTWTDLISLDISQLGLSRELTYATVEYPPDGQPPRTRLRAWRGYHELWREVYY